MMIRGTSEIIYFKVLGFLQHFRPIHIVHLDN